MSSSRICGKLSSEASRPLIIPEQLPIIVTTPEKEAVDEMLYTFPKRIEQKDDDDRQHQGEDERIAASGQKKVMEEENDEDVERRSECPSAGSRPFPAG